MFVNHGYVTLSDEHKLWLIVISGLKWTFGYEKEEVAAYSRKPIIRRYKIYTHR
jgi:hypothetical protein